jgi:hypothetical protein
MSEYRPVTDRSGSVHGVWVRDPGVANDPGQLSTLLLRENFANEIVAWVSSGQYRVVPNTYDDAGGVFVMFGSAPAPGERAGGAGRGTGRMNRQQVRSLALVWTLITMAVGVGVFLVIWWQMAGAGEEIPGAESAATVPQPGLTSPTQDTGGAAGVEPAGQPTPTIPPAQDPSFGYGIQVQAHMDTNRTLDMVNQLGLGWIKQQIRWADLEPAQGAANWDALDGIFQAASDHHLRVLISIVDAPDWARSTTAEGRAGPPDDFQNYVNYVTQMVSRYPGQIHAIEVWNEQNLDREWYTAGGLSPERYVEMLSMTRDAVRAIDPGVIVISGALAPTGVNDATARDDFIYMQQMIDAGLLDNTDCVGAHANGINLPPGISAEEAYAQGAPAGTIFLGPYDTSNALNPHHSWSFNSTLRGYRDMIVAAGYDTPLCVTEFGWATVEGMNGDPRPGFEFAYDNTLESQAENIVDAFQLMHEWDFVWLAFLFNLDYSPKAGGNTQDDSTLYSILTPEGTARPAFEALRDMPKPP